MSRDYPRFSPREMTRRRRLLTEAMEVAGVAHVVVYGADRSGSAVGWLSGWPVTREAALVITPGEQDLLFVQFRNHVPNAEEMAPDADVRWGGDDTMASVAEALRRRRGTVGVVGPLRHRDHVTLAEACGELRSLDGAYAAMRLVKSAEELLWMRRGARLSDAAALAIRDQARPGMTVHDLVAICEGAYVAEGGTTHIHYFGVTSMDDPRRCVPAQWPAGRPVADGDAITFEISASWWGYPGQLLRTVIAAREPAPRYRVLHAVAEAAFDAVAGAVRAGAHAADLVAAATLIEESGFTIYDDLVHGFGGGYWPPVLRLRSQAEPPDITLEAGMTIVIQPNVITPDERAGVQTGELVVVTDDGFRRLHAAPRGLWRLGEDEA